MADRITAKELAEWRQSAAYFAATGKGKNLSRPAQALVNERLLVAIDEIELLQRHTKVGVMAVIRRGDEILLGRKGRAFDAAFEGKWVLPGGRLGLSEPLHTALLREIKEETGLDVEVLRSLWPQEIIHEKGHYVFLVWEVTPIGGTLQAGDDLTEVRWFSPEDVAEHQMTPITRAVIWKAFHEHPTRPS